MAYHRRLRRRPERREVAETDGSTSNGSSSGPRVRHGSDDLRIWVCRGEGGELESDFACRIGAPAAALSAEDAASSSSVLQREEWESDEREMKKSED